MNRYKNEHDALEAINREWSYWGEVLGRRAVEFCYAVIGATWLSFRTIDEIMSNDFAFGAILLAVTFLILNLCFSYYVVFEYARTIHSVDKMDATQLDQRFASYRSGSKNDFPYPERVERIGDIFHLTKLQLPLMAGIYYALGIAGFNRFSWNALFCSILG